MDLKEEDFEKLQTMCKYIYIGNHHSKYLCRKYKGWVDCTYNNCPKIMKPCDGTISVNGEVIGKITAINKII